MFEPSNKPMIYVLRAPVERDEPLVRIERPAANVFRKRDLVRIAKASRKATNGRKWLTR